MVRTLTFSILMAAPLLPSVHSLEGKAGENRKRGKIAGKYEGKRFLKEIQTGCKKNHRPRPSIWPIEFHDVKAQYCWSKQILNSTCK